MRRAYDREMAAINCGDVYDPQPLGRRDDRRVDRPEWKIAIARDELRDPQQVARQGTLKRERAAREIA